MEIRINQPEEDDFYDDDLQLQRISILQRSNQYYRKRIKLLCAIAFGEALVIVILAINLFGGA